MRKENIICKKTRRTFEEYENIVLTITLLLGLVYIIPYYTYRILINSFSYSLLANLVLFVSMVVSLTIGVLYYNWAQSWNYSTVVTEKGMYTSRKDMETGYKKAYRKGYFIPWSEISKVAITKTTPSGWLCLFTTTYGDTIKISTEQKYDDNCFLELMILIEGLKKKGVNFSGVLEIVEEYSEEKNG